MQPKYAINLCCTVLYYTILRCDMRYCTVVYYSILHIHTVMTILYMYCMHRLLYCNHTVMYTHVHNVILYMSMTVMRRCDVDLGGCRVHLIGDTDVTNSTISLPPWWQQSYMKARIAIKSHNQINMSNQLSYPHPHSPHHMMAMNRAWNVSKPLCKDMMSARKRVFNPWDVTFPMAVVLKNQPIARIHGTWHSPWRLCLKINR